MTRPDDPRSVRTTHTMRPADVARIAELGVLMQCTNSAALRSCLPTDPVMEVYKKVLKRNPSLSYGAFIEQVLGEWQEAGYLRLKMLRTMTTQDKVAAYERQPGQDRGLRRREGSR